MRSWLPCVAALLSLLTACGNSSAAPTPALDALAEQGKQLFTQNCATCHALAPDTLIVGPSLAGVAARAGSRIPDLDAKSYIELSILKPDVYVVAGFSDLMPKDFGKKLTGEEFDALVAFLMTLE